jgi:hypothetical protein
LEIVIFSSSCTDGDVLRVLILDLVDFMLPVSNILRSVLPHDLSKLREGVRGILLVVYGDSGVMAEVYSTDCKKMLDIVLLNKATQVVLDCFVPATAKSTSVEL